MPVTIGGKPESTFDDPIGLLSEAELEADHRRADYAHSEVDLIGKLWIERGRLPERESSRLAELLAELTDLYRQHIAVEDGEVFPLAASVLSPAERKAVGQEIASRRGVLPPP